MFVVFVVFGMLILFLIASPPRGLCVGTEQGSCQTHLAPKGRQGGLLGLSEDRPDARPPGEAPSGHGSTRGRCPAARFYGAGSVKKNAAPRPNSLSTQMRPPCPSTMLLQMCKPNPNPRRVSLSIFQNFSNT
jgi:hypothetical protein